MRRDLTAPPEPTAPPPGVALLPWTDGHAALFFTAYAASFTDRPGYPDPPEAAWVEHTASEDDFDPAASRVALDPAGRPAGFVVAAGPWVSQIGVVPL